jgi:membrane metallo-endopeptidase-like protein 1
MLKYFVQETAQEMIGNIREAFIELLEENHWMDVETRKVAKEKAMKINERIGYPDFLTSNQELNKEYQNVIKVSQIPRLTFPIPQLSFFLSCS